MIKNLRDFCFRFLTTYEKTQQNRPFINTFEENDEFWKILVIDTYRDLGKVHKKLDSMRSMLLPTIRPYKYRDNIVRKIRPQTILRS